MIKIEHNNQVYAIIIPAEFEKDGIEFFTPNDYSQQLAYMKRPRGYKIQPHTHKSIQREVTNTLETLLIKKGRLRVDIYSDKQKYLSSYELKTGDVILLISGGHGFEMLEDTEIIEVKQGPYIGDQDKIRFKI